MKRFLIWLLLFASGFLVLVGQGVMLMVFAFAFLLLKKEKFRLSNPKNTKKKVFFVLLGFSLLFEVGAIIMGYSENEFGGGTLFHPNPVLDIFISLFYWVPFSLFWTHLLTTYAYTKKSIFVIGGLYGVLTEQLFMVPMLLFTLNPLVFIAAPYLFILYGSAIAAPFLVVEKLLPKDLEFSRKQYLLPLLVLFPMLFIIFAILHTVTGGSLQ